MSTKWSEKGTILIEKLVRKRYYFGGWWYYMTFGNTEKPGPTLVPGVLSLNSKEQPNILAVIAALNVNMCMQV